MISAAVSACGDPNFCQRAGSIGHGPLVSVVAWSWCAAPEIRWSFANPAWAF